MLAAAGLVVGWTNSKNGELDRKNTEVEDKNAEVVAERDRANEEKKRANEEKNIQKGQRASMLAKSPKAP